MSQTVLLRKNRKLAYFIHQLSRVEGCPPGASAAPDGGSGESEKALRQESGAGCCGHWRGSDSGQGMFHPSHSCGHRGAEGMRLRDPEASTTASKSNIKEIVSNVLTGASKIRRAIRFG